MTNEQQPWGATPDEWFTLEMLGLTADLLPVVSNPLARIAESSKITAKTLGKVPSWYSGSLKFVAGIPDWNNRVTTAAEVAAWSRQPDYGACLIGRTVKALDCDLTDSLFALRVREVIWKLAGTVLPCRFRANSPKFLLAFRLEGVYVKRVIKTAHGIIEFLADNQQFLVAGTHSSGARYEWNRLDSGIPTLTPEQFEALWLALQGEFSVEPSVEPSAHGRAPQLSGLERACLMSEVSAATMAELASAVAALKAERSVGYADWMPVIMSLASLKSTEFADQALELAHEFSARCEAKYAPDALNDWWDCLEAGRITYKSIFKWAQDDGWANPAQAPAPLPTDALFEALPDAPAQPVAGGKTPATWAFVGDSAYMARPKPKWLVKGFLPQAQLAVLYGASGSGKTFLMLDLVYAIARGEPWRGAMGVKQGRVAYIAGEGAGFLRNRLHAYHAHNGTEATDDLRILDGQPNLMDAGHVIGLIHAIRDIGGVSVVVVDTYASCMVGDENSSKDATLVLTHCRRIHQHTGAMVILVHHSGKDAGRGARGSSALRAGIDCELEVLRDSSDRRSVSSSKQRDGRDGEDLAFTLKEVAIDDDDDGVPMSSCVVVHEGALPVFEKLKKEEPKTSPILEVVQDFYTNKGEWPDRELAIKGLRALIGATSSNAHRALRTAVEKGDLVEAGGKISVKEELRVLLAAE